MFHPLLFYFHLSFLIAYQVNFPPVPILSVLAIIFLRSQDMLYLWAGIVGAGSGHVLYKRRPSKNYVGIVAQFLAAFIAYDGTLLFWKLPQEWTIPLVMCIDYYTLSWRRFKLKTYLTLPISLFLLLWHDDLQAQLMALPLNLLIVLGIHMMNTTNI